MLQVAHVCSHAVQVATMLWLSIAIGISIAAVCKYFPLATPCQLSTIPM